ncbi:uncharacterized protein si:ch211-51h4.2 [Rhinichthys klamathensis goyatoka]|uniref:uncharacterized protein si:ch211-51h4.2 n=1 Tax=Rhinichthys klamathensis goyatoka TaxID=3034132 RepID=UPI0024B5EA11|nr:uncharacterized protein si:ch211-51h4.2 [Rhinichthys klamathensis goyatoka]
MSGLWGWRLQTAGSGMSQTNVCCQYSHLGQDTVIVHVYVIPAFTWTLSLGIILGQVIIQPITSLLTLLKGILLVITVSVTFVVGSEVHQETTNDFTQIGKPFLMGTVALGGIVNVMPFLFSEISHVKTQVLWFRRAVLGGLATCTLLNILWLHTLGSGGGAN